MTRCRGNDMLRYRSASEHGGDPRKLREAEKGETISPELGRVG